jgi:hypothetical protein
VERGGEGWRGVERGGEGRRGGRGVESDAVLWLPFSNENCRKNRERERERERARAREGEGESEEKDGEGEGEGEMEREVDREKCKVLNHWVFSICFYFIFLLFTIISISFSLLAEKKPQSRTSSSS